ncbi:MucB/RseB C-terminal domain-containing protein [Dokdonella sp.]|uniref:MucB/RseB C-terminal domain-containing protein n=1 Tax=Dokdonella sp. TaxID=2291710 RepID=UPI003783D6CA
MALRPDRIAVLWMVLALAVASAPSRAEPTATSDPLARMYAAIRQLDFQGSFVYLRGGKAEAMRIFHAGGSPERERLVGLNGARTEIAREGGVVTCVSGDAPSKLFDTPGVRLLPLLPDLRGGSVAAYYAVSAGDEERVAGYRARRIDIVARDGYRYGYRLWMEDHSGLPLRSSIVDASGRILEEYMFVTLDIGARPRDSDLAPSTNAGVAEAAGETLVEPRWQIADPPPGFVLTRTQKPALGDERSEHQIYTDGLASVSIYVEPHSGANGADRGFARGMLNMLTREAGGWRVAAIGDVPRGTLERMLGSMRPLPAALKHD